jgi:hypothetical protein
MGLPPHSNGPRGSDRPIDRAAHRADVHSMIAELLGITESELMMVAGAVVSLLASALIGWKIGERRYRPLLGVVLGGLLTVPGLIAIWVIPEKEPAYY